MSSDDDSVMSTVGTRQLHQKLSDDDDFDSKQRPPKDQVAKGRMECNVVNPDSEEDNPPHKVIAETTGEHDMTSVGGDDLSGCNDGRSHGYNATNYTKGTYSEDDGRGTKGNFMQVPNTKQPVSVEETHSCKEHDEGNPHKTVTDSVADGNKMAVPHCCREYHLKMMKMMFNCGNCDMNHNIMWGHLLGDKVNKMSAGIQHIFKHETDIEAYKAMGGDWRF